MQKTIKGYEGDTTLYFDDETEGRVWIQLTGQLGYSKKVFVFDSGKAEVSYTNPFSETYITKNVDNTTKYTYDYLKSEKFKPSDKSLHEVLEAFMNLAKIDTIDD
ncbi:MAG: hypothetical protein QXP59_03985 [Saccharolobus sp.]